MLGRTCKRMISKAEVLRLRKEHMSSGILMYYKEPLMITRGSMQYLYDEEDKEYLDLFGGIVTVSVGHCHPRVTAAAIDQMKTLQHTTTIYANPQIAQYAKELTDKFPDPLNVAYVVNSGSEANDLAMLMARLHTGNFDYVALRNAYHGGSYNAMGLTAHSTWKFNVPTGFGIHHARNPDTFRGPFPASDPDHAAKYAEDVSDLIKHSTSGAVAGFISEPIQGVGGSVVMPKGYLPRVYKTVREAGGLCVADEVQTGFGRTGDHYWGFESHDVVPDIVVMAKGIGNGCPLAAVVTTREIADTVSGRLHFNTYGGNPVCAAIGREVLKVIDEEGLQQRSLELGARFTEGLRSLQQKHETMGDVRGQGLMLGVEFVASSTDKTPNTAAATAVFEGMRQRGVLIGKGGLSGNVLRIKPPMCLTEADIDRALEAMQQCLVEHHL